MSRHNSTASQVLVAVCAGSSLWGDTSNNALTDRTLPELRVHVWFALRGFVFVLLLASCLHHSEYEVWSCIGPQVWLYEFDMTMTEIC